MRYLVSSICVLAAGLAATSVSAADTGSTAGFRLRATVQPFCRIQTEATESTPLIVTDGVIELGSVREVCNTAGGYTVNVQMINVTGGDLEHGEGVSAVDGSGRTQVLSHQARARTSFWRLRNAVMQTSDAPAYMRVSISPL